LSPDVPDLAAPDIARLTEAVAAVSPGAAAMRVPADFANPAMAGLAAAINAMVARFDEGHAALQRFTWDAAHQLRTPLAVLAARLSAPSPPDLDDIRGDLEWMSRLVSQLLSAARAAEAAPRGLEPMDLMELAQDVVSALAPLAIYRGRMIELIGEDDAAIVVRGERGFAFEALSNLIENAIGHAPEGGLISVSVLAPARVEVADNGPGVPPSHRESIFCAFEQGPSPGRGGAGLGLAIVTQVMQRHGGQASYRDNPGGGAIFSLDFKPWAAAPELAL
jgi:signal transduction histidine kinase